MPQKYERVEGRPTFEVRGSAIFHEHRLSILYWLAERPLTLDALQTKLFTRFKSESSRFRSKWLSSLDYHLGFLADAGFVSVKKEACSLTPLGRAIAQLAYRDGIHDVVGSAQRPPGEVSYLLLATMGARAWSLKEMIYLNRRRLDKKPYTVHPNEEPSVVRSVKILRDRQFCKRDKRGSYRLTDAGLRLFPVLFLLWSGLDSDEIADAERATVVSLSKASYAIHLLEQGYNTFIGDRSIRDALSTIRQFVPGIAIPNLVAAPFEDMRDRLLQERFFKLVSKCPKTYAPTLYSIGMGYLIETNRVDSVWLLECLSLDRWEQLRAKVHSGWEQIDAAISDVFLRAIMVKGVQPEQLRYFWGMVEPVKGFMPPDYSCKETADNHAARVSMMRYEVLNSINLATQIVEKRDTKLVDLIPKMQTEALVEAIWLKGLMIKGCKRSVSTPACAVYASAHVAYKHGFIPNLPRFYRSIMTSRYNSTHYAKITLPTEYKDLRRACPIELKPIPETIRQELGLWRLNDWISLRDAKTLNGRSDKTVQRLARCGLPTVFPRAVDAAIAFICLLRLCRLEGRLNNRKIDANFISRRFGIDNLDQLFSKVEAYLALLEPRKTVSYLELDFRHFRPVLASLLEHDVGDKVLLGYCRLTGRTAYEYKYETRREVLLSKLDSLRRGVVTFDEFKQDRDLQLAALKVSIGLMESLFRVDIRSVSPYACATYACTYVAFDNNLHADMEGFYRSHLQNEKFSDAAYRRLSEILPREDKTIFELIESRLGDWESEEVEGSIIEEIRKRMHEVAERFSKRPPGLQTRRSTLLDAAVVVDYTCEHYKLPLGGGFLVSEFGVSRDGINVRAKEVGML